MTQRGSGFKSLEDIILCNSYVTHTTNSEIGTYQRKDDMWEKITIDYNHEAVDKQNLEHRGTKSLIARFAILGAACTLFRGCLTQATAQAESGTNEVDLLKNAKDLYKGKEPKGYPFKYDHAWDILKYHEKWVDPLIEADHSKDTDSPQEGTNISQDSDDVGVVRSQRNRSGSEGRPTGRNAAKARRKATNERDPMWQEMMNSAARSQELMEKQRADNFAINQSRETRANKLLTLEQGKLEHKQKKLYLKQQQQEMEIMNKDLSNLTPFSKAFWTSKKRAILDNEDMPRAARTLRFNDGEGSGGGNADVYRPEPFDPNRATDFGEYNTNHGIEDFPLE